jgi:hypothetical protein
VSALAKRVTKQLFDAFGLEIRKKQHDKLPRTSMAGALYQLSTASAAATLLPAARLVRPQQLQALSNHARQSGAKSTSCVFSAVASFTERFAVR